MQQLPVNLEVFKASIEESKEQIKKATEQALSIVPIPEMLPALKAERATLRKQFEALETKRKELKNAIMEPYNDFEKAYKENVANIYKSADGQLKSNIDTLEQQLKDECLSELEKYFQECCKLYNITWLKYEQLGVPVSITDAKTKDNKRLKKTIKDAVFEIHDEVNSIAKLPNSAEILAEYKKSLNFSQAVDIVAERKRAIDEANQIQQDYQQAEKAVEESVNVVIEETNNIEIPLTVEQEELFECVFKVKATKTQLKKLKEFLATENIEIIK